MNRFDLKTDIPINFTTHIISGFTKDCTRFFYYQGLSEEDAVSKAMRWLEDNDLHDDDLETLVFMHVRMRKVLGVTTIVDEVLETIERTDDGLLLTNRGSSDYLVNILADASMKYKRFMKTFSTGQKLSKECAKKGKGFYEINKRGCIYTINVG